MNQIEVKANYLIITLNIGGGASEIIKEFSSKDTIYQHNEARDKIEITGSRNSVTITEADIDAGEWQDGTPTVLTVATMLDFLRSNTGNFSLASGSGATVGDVATWDGIKYVPQAPAPSNNLGNSDLTIDTAGTRKLIMAGALSSDLFAVRNSADSNALFNVDGIGNVWSNGKNQIISNTVFGQLALDGSNPGTNNTVFGYGAASSSNGLDDQVIIGRSAGALVTSAQKGVIIGSFAGGDVTSAFGATLVGYRAGDAIQTVAGCSMFGYESGQGTTGQYNTCVGSRAGYDLTTGEYNIILGARNLGNGITTGNENVVIGSQISGLAAGLSNNILITDGGANQGFRKDANNNIIFGPESALAPAAAEGFRYIRGGAGAPTGAPATSIAGHYPEYWDSTNKKKYIYDGSWIALN